MDTTELKERLWQLRQKSILSWISEDNLPRLVDEFAFNVFQKGQFFNEEIHGAQFPILLSGKACLVSRDSNNVVDKIVPGRSFELSSYIQDKKREYRWLAQETCIVATIDFQRLRAFLLESGSYLYLERISTRVELQKIKNDLRMLGVPNQVSKEIISKLVLSNEMSSSGLNVIAQGIVSISTSDSEQAVASLRISDYFLGKNTDLTITPGEDSQFWALPSTEDLKTFLDEATYQFLDKIRDLEKSIEQQSSNTEDDDVYDEPEEEEDFEIEHFHKNNVKKQPKTLSSPVAIRQHDAMDCGAACMSMISNYYKRKINISTWRRLIHITREGASMLAVKNAAARVGFDTVGVMSGPKYLVDFVTPFIALMSYHYVVVYKIDQEKVQIADPARGLVTITMEEFKSDFSGNALLLRPNERLASYPESPAAYKKYLNLFTPHFVDLAQIVVFSAILFIMNLAPPLFTQYIFDSVIPSGNTQSMKMIATIAIAFSVVVMLLSLVRLSFMIKIASTISLKLTALFFRQILRLPLSYFAVRNVGDITTRVDELEKIRAFFTKDSIQIFMDILAVVVYTGILTIYHPYLAWLTVVCIFICILVISPLSKKLKQMTQDLFHSMGGASSIMFEQLAGLRTIQNLTGNLQARWRWEEKQTKVLDRRQKIETSIASAMSLSALINQLMSLSYLTLAVYLFMQREITIGQVVASISISSMVIMPILSLIQAIDNIGQLNVSFEKVDEIVTSKVEEDNGPAKFPLDFKTITFKDVWFKYGSDFSPWILKGINLSVKRGEKIAFVGPSGSGKSTASYMLNLIYQHQKGEILFDEVNNTDISLRELRENITMIVQDNSILSGTVLSNISLGDTTPNLVRATQAAKLAEAHDFIMSLPEGYQTAIGGEHGVSMSGGQKQRISIARALYKSPSIVILDEATSALDTITEKKVMNNLYTTLKDTTCFIIAHRFNTIMNADRIVVIKDGKIKEMGTHTDLMKKQGIYYSMFKKQISL